MPTRPVAQGGRYVKGCLYMAEVVVTRASLDEVATGSTNRSLAFSTVRAVPARVPRRR